MFMYPTDDIATPLYGITCFTDCATAHADGYCQYPSVAAACGASCGAGAPGDFADLLTPATGSTPEYKVCLSPFQSKVQIVLLLASVCSVPFLLLPIPLIEMYQHAAKTKKKKQYAELPDEADADGGHGDHDEEFSAGDAFIHQARAETTPGKHAEIRPR